jgi:hypothetical protein
MGPTTKIDTGLARGSGLEFPGYAPTALQPGNMRLLVFEIVVQEHVRTMLRDTILDGPCGRTPAQRAAVTQWI